MNKEHIERLLIEILKDAERNGITIACASDPEGNSFNKIDYTYSGTKENIIVLSVDRDLEESDLFN